MLVELLAARMRTAWRSSAVPETPEPEPASPHDDPGVRTWRPFGQPCFFADCDEQGVERLIVAFTPQCMHPKAWYHEAWLCSGHTAYMMTEPRVTAQLLLLETP